MDRLLLRLRDLLLLLLFSFFSFFLFLSFLFFLVFQILVPWEVLPSLSDAMVCTSEPPPERSSSWWSLFLLCPPMSSGDPSGLRAPAPPAAPPRPAPA